MIAQPVQTVALAVLRRLNGQHAEFGGGLGVEQEQDPVQEPQRLLRQRLRLIGRQRRQPQPSPPGDHLVGDDLDRPADALAKVLADADGVLHRLRQHPGPPDLPVGVGGK
jgi:hypothetical protein